MSGYTRTDAQIGSLLRLHAEALGDRLCALSTITSLLRHAEAEREAGGKLPAPLNGARIDGLLAALTIVADSAYTKLAHVLGDEDLLIGAVSGGDARRDEIDRAMAYLEDEGMR